jgi:hypothetical protein
VLIVVLLITSILATGFATLRNFEMTMHFNGQSTGNHLKQPALVLIDNNFYVNGGITYAAELKVMFSTVKPITRSAIFFP